MELVQKLMKYLFYSPLTEKVLTEWTCIFTIWTALDRGGTSTSSFMTTAPGWSAGRERVATTLLMKSAILMTGTVNVAFITRLQNGGLGNIYLHLIFRSDSFYIVG